MKFISDTHFYHFNVVKYTNRPFTFEVRDGAIYSGDTKIRDLAPEENPEQAVRVETIKKMNDHMIKQWNANVCPVEKVYFLGDFGYGGIEGLKEVASKLNGYKILIRGNHDKKEKTMLEVGFDEVMNEGEIMIKGEKVLLHHYPYLHPKLTVFAKKRPNIINYKTKEVKENLIPVEVSKNWVDFLASNLSKPVYTKGENGEAIVKNLKRLISTTIGTRKINCGEILLHGHSHSYDKRFANMINLSVEAWDYKPAGEEEIALLIEEFKKELNGEFLDETNYNTPVYQYYQDLRYRGMLDVRGDFFKKIVNLCQLVSEYERIFSGEKYLTEDVPQGYTKKWYDLCQKYNGFIPEKDLVKDKFYKGSCRNASWAKWDGAKFIYIRSKFGYKFLEEINSVEQDDGYDVFIPHELYSPSEEELSFYEKGE